MAAPLRFYILLSLTLISTHLTTIHGVFSEQSHIMLPTYHHHTEKMTRLHFFYHETLEPQNPTVVQIIDPPNSSKNAFGSTFMMDSILTEGKELSSKPVGRAQGLFGLASLEDSGMVMLINFVFTEGDYAGSTLSLLGRNPVQDTVREIPIVGGTGVFRFAKGYAILKSLWDISSAKDFVVEYNITVSHP
ncbi:dirigent protein 11-like [Gastrolobium bilobum]|uniref:dirigent protein 11-like n=1 Tax=Gastrolobium bilobum TaxID=150636 RepID=UPI002AB0AC7E|nr:dirigent protein 11-like [Gastrolobium bilobum]